MTSESPPNSDSESPLTVRGLVDELLDLNGTEVVPEEDYELRIETPYDSYRVKGLRFEHDDKHVVIEVL